MHKVIVIHASDRDTSNEFFYSIGFEGETFTVPLFDRLDQLVGYWCGVEIEDEQIPLIESTFALVFDTSEEALSACGWHVYVEPEVNIG